MKILGFLLFLKLKVVCFVKTSMLDPVFTSLLPFHGLSVLIKDGIPV